MRKLGNVKTLIGSFGLALLLFMGTSGTKVFAATSGGNSGGGPVIGDGNLSGNISKITKTIDKTTNANGQIEEYFSVVIEIKNEEGQVVDREELFWGTIYRNPPATKDQMKLLMSLSSGDEVSIEKTQNGLRITVSQ